jgi:hypothetical protein
MHYATIYNMEYSTMDVKRSICLGNVERQLSVVDVSDGRHVDQ